MRQIAYVVGRAHKMAALGHVLDVEVVAPVMGGIVVGHEVARGFGCRSIFTEREGTSMTLRRGFTLEKDEAVVIVEDVVTTGKSTREVIAVVEAVGGRVIGIASVVDRVRGGPQRGEEWFLGPLRKPLEDRRRFLECGSLPSVRRGFGSREHQRLFKPNRTAIRALGVRSVRTCPVLGRPAKASTTICWDLGGGCAAWGLCDPIMEGCVGVPKWMARGGQSRQPTTGSQRRRETIDHPPSVGGRDCFAGR